MLSAKGFLAATTRSYLRLRLLLPLILIGLLLPSAAPAQITEPGTAATGNAGSDANAGVAVPNGIQGTNGNFGKVNVGASSATPLAIVFTFEAGVTLVSTAVVTQGAKNLDFTDAGGGTCTPNKSYIAGDTCTVKVTFKPRAPGARYGGVELLDTSGNLLANGYVQGIGVGPLVTFVNTSSGGYSPSKQTFLASGSIAPNCVAIDVSGNLFITDGTDGPKVKEILAVNGSIPASPTIKTLGSGFEGPYCVAVDGIGNVFVADRYAAIPAVKEIMATGGYTTVKTLGGGFHFGGPNGVAVDGIGNVFIADWVDSAVYEIVAAGGYTTVKNLVPGSFDAADYVAVDGSSNVYVADFYNGAVKEIMAAGGYTTVKTLRSGIGGVSSVAVDASGNLFVSLWGQGTAYEIVAAGGYTTMNALSGGYTYLNSVAVDASGNVFIPDGAHSRVVKLDYADPPSLTFAKTSVGVESSDSPQTVTVSNVGNQALVFTAVSYPADFSEASGGGVDLCTSSTSLDSGQECDLNIEFAPEQTGALSENVTLTDNVLNVTGTEQSIAVKGTATPSISATHLSVTGPSNVGAYAPFTITVTALDVSSGTATGYTGTVSFTSSDGSAVLPAASKLTAGIGNFSVTLKTQGNQTITVTDAANSLTGTSAAINVGATPPGVYPGQGGVNFGSQAIGSPSGTKTLSFRIGAGTTVGSIAVVTQGAANLDFTSATGSTCTATTYSSVTNCTVNVTFKPRAPGPRYGAVVFTDGSGNLLANGYIQGTGVGPQVSFANRTSGMYLPGEEVSLGSGFGGPVGVAVDGSGNVFVADRGNNAVKEILATGGYITVKTLSSAFNSPNGVAVDGAGNLFATDSGNHAVKEFLAAGGYTTIKTLGGGFGFGGPANMSLDGSGNVFVADWDNSAVYEILAAGGYTTVKTLGSGFFHPDDTAVDGSGNVFVSDTGHDAVKEILAVGGYTTVKTLGSGFSIPGAVAVDASGNVYVADELHSAVKEIVAAGGYTTVISLGNGFSIPAGIALDGSGNLFVSENRSNIVVKLDYADPPSLTFAKTSVGVESSDSPQTVTVSNNGNADLTFPVPASGHNPSISSGFTLDVLTTCPELSASSTADTLAAGASCDYAVDFIPVAGANSGSLTLTDNNLNASPAVTQAISLTGTVTGPHLAFTTPPPASLAVGQGPGTVAVSVEDSSNKVLTTSSATITLTVTGPNSYSKVYTAKASSGIATFSSLASLTTAGSYTYTATDIPDGLVQAVATESVFVPHLAFTTPPPASLALGHLPGTVAVSVEDPSNNVMTTSSATVTLTVTGPNSYSKVYTATASSGIATFSSLASLTTAGSYTYTATDTPDGLTQAVATESVWAPHLAFTTPPRATLALGHLPGTVAVSVEDSSNKVMTTSSATVTLTVTGPNSYSKVYTATASSGIATFSSLASLTTAGSYTYTATDTPDGLTQVVATESVWTPHLAFTPPPSTVLLVGWAPGTVEVSEQDLNNNGMSTFSATVTLTVTGPSSYSKVYTAKASSGSAMFRSLASLTTAGNYTYTATDTLDGLTQAVAHETVFGPPSAISVSPSSGFGTTQKFSFMASSPNGAGDLAFVNMMFNTIGSQVNGCYLTWFANDNQLTLLSDDHTTSSSGQPGATGTLSNSQCSVNLSATTVTASGNTLTIAPTITFKSGFKAGLHIYMFVQDVQGENTGWKTLGWWMVGSVPESAPSAVSVSPSSGFGTTQKFSFVASSPNGAGNLAEVDMLFNTSGSRVNACYLNYLAAGNQLSLLSDDHDTSTSGHPGATGTLSNSQCSVNLSATTVTASGNTLTLAPTMTFTSAFRPGIHIYMYVQDVPGMNSGWKKMSP